jgi:hypothetical protein
MKISKIELTGRNLVIAITVSTALAIFAIYMIFYAPLLRELGRKYNELMICEKQTACARDVINSAGSIYSDRVLMMEKDIALAISQLTKHGKEMGINFISITPKDLIDEKGAEYKIFPVEMEIEAADEKFSDFIGSLEDQKATVIKVTSFDITPVKGDGSRLNAKVVIYMYISKREYAE